MIAAESIENYRFRPESGLTPDTDATRNNPDLTNDKLQDYTGLPPAKSAASIIPKIGSRQ